jgi:cell division septum initiation protein DivIVA
MSNSNHYDEVDEAIAQLWLAVAQLLEENKQLKEKINGITNDRCEKVA